MKSELISTHNTEELDLPCLMVHYSGTKVDLIVLTSEIDRNKHIFSGTVVYQNDGSWKVGSYSRTWTLSSFKPFMGEIKLSN